MESAAIYRVSILAGVNHIEKIFFIVYGNTHLGNYIGMHQSDN